MDEFKEWWKKELRKDNLEPGTYRLAEAAWKAALTLKTDGGAEVTCSAVLFAGLEDVKRLIDSPTLTAACGCYSEGTGGSTAAYFALDKVTLRVQKIIDEISK